MMSGFALFFVAIKKILVFINNLSSFFTGNFH